MDTDVDARANTQAPEHRGMLSTLPRDPRAAARTEPVAPAETRITPIEVGSEWLRLADRFRDHNYRQLFDYAEALAARTGSTAEHLRIDHGDEPIGLASVRVKRMPGTGIAYVSGGPLVRTGANRDRGPHLDLVLKALVGEYVDRRRLVLRVSPALGDPAWNAEQERRFVAARFLQVDHLSRYRTIAVDIGGSLADVRAAFAKKWRYSLKQAEKAEISVTEGSDPALLDQFAPLFRELVARKSLSVDLGADFYGSLQRALPAEERLHVAIASIGGEPAAGIVASLLGDTAVYLLGASNESGRSACAPYLLQWKTIEAAAARGIRWYDLGGIDPDANPGVHRFKARMGGEEICAPGPYEAAPGRVRAGAVRTAERLFRAARGRRG